MRRRFSLVLARDWLSRTWYGLRTLEMCQKPVGNSVCRRKHNHPGFHKPYK